MPRKAFIADFEAAKQQGIAGITDISRGENDEDINVTFVSQNGVPVEICLLTQPDVGSYPTETFFMIFVRTSEAPPGVAAALEDISGFSHGMKIPELVTTISQKLRNVLSTGARDAPFLVDDESDVEMRDGTDAEEEFEEESQDEYADYGGFSDEEDRGNRGLTSATHRISPEAAVKLNRRIRHDLKAAKFAGFSLGILNGMKADSVSSLVSISIRVAKLGLSEEAIQAWDLEPHQYVVLLIRYSNGYKTFESVIEEPAKSSDIEFRIGVCNRYKPTIVEALAAFTDITRDNNKANQRSNDQENRGTSDSESGFANMFISSSLNDFINTQFISLFKMRCKLGVGWEGAKKFMADNAGRVGENTEDLPEVYYKESDSAQNSLPDVVTADHLCDLQVKEHSFPLICAQFALRYFCRCTEFCLVCHDKIQEEFGALKPYVCSKPLCLYQYMSLGFGPSVEHEIMMQPYVVDLLVSFCYAAAMQRKLREYPTGMSLNVPPILTYVTSDSSRGLVGKPLSIPGQAAVGAGQALKAPILPTKISFDPGHNEILFSGLSSCPVHIGDWVTISVAGLPADHYRVEDISLFPNVIVSKPIRRSTVIPEPDRSATTLIVPATPVTTPPPAHLQPATMTIYNNNFDEMGDTDKAETIVMALETLPSISSLQNFLKEQSRFSEPNLRAWKEQISPAALGILRWIIASNRSCIVQVDKCPGQGDAEVAAAKIRLNQRVSNVSESWVQFRFAQGSPDKEQKFLNALKVQQSSFDAQYPTIFAFHGSPLPNWHSIIRHGLDFKEVIHGRAFGNGVYHSPDQNVSVGYMGHGSRAWHGSALKVMSAMSLNEIVNCPTQFAHTNPHLVVQHIEWIQCRYLFVQVGGDDRYAAGGNSNTVSHTPGLLDQIVEQDPKYTARSTLGKVLGVPLCAVAVSRAFRVSAANNVAMSTQNQASGKKRKISKVVVASSEYACSEGEDISDINFLFSEDEDSGNSKNKATNPHLDAKGRPWTDFVPGTLDQAQLPLLSPPSYASQSATKTLSRALKEVVEIQKKTPLHELGWFIDEELISNVYQWIVELHSFDASLPLAKEMKQAGMTSIVLEIRFGKNFPFSPPFVRVIRPRFLPFMQGGGGHVTAGGAICMELLTNSGWSSVSSLESVLLQVRLAISSTDPKPARLENGGRSGVKSDYGTSEAIEAYLRACQAHGWAIPPGFREEFGSEPSRYGGF